MEKNDETKRRYFHSITHNRLNLHTRRTFRWELTGFGGMGNRFPFARA